MIVRNPPVLPPITGLWLCIVLYALASVCAQAGELKLTLRDSSGKPVKDAVVSFAPDQGAEIGLDLKQKAYVMAQQGMNFAPHVLVVPKGASVQFPNRDTVSHHVYSFSPVHNFQLPLYGPRVTRSERFDKLGTVALGCNIHDSMSAYIRVVDTPYFALSDASGVIVLSGLPETKGRLDVWHPLQSTPDNLISKSLTPAATVSLNLTLKLRRLAKVSEAY
jgi:plastocyanin